jgi:hypothetical protein
VAAPVRAAAERPSEAELPEDIVFRSVHPCGLRRCRVIKTKIVEQTVNNVKKKFRLAAVSAQLCLPGGKLTVDYNLEICRSAAAHVREIEAETIGDTVSPQK